MSLKNKLKKINFFYSINASYKARKMKKDLQKLRERYDVLAKDVDENEAKVIVDVQKKLIARGVDFKSLNRKLRIFWVGANYAQDDSGFLQALNKFAEVHYFYNAQKQYGQEFSPERMNPDIVTRNSECLISQVKEIEKTKGKVDLVMGQMWANYISEQSLIDIQSMNIATVNISMDDRLPELWETYKNKLMGAIGISKGIDLTLTTTKDCVKRFLYHKALCLFWPLASDKNLFMPSDVKDIDVVFVGNNYGIRGEIVGGLLAAGINVQAYGGGWPNGLVDAAKATNLFNRSKIILGIGTIGYCDDVYTIKLRDFDATMAGALYITHRNPDLLEIFKEGEEIECYLNVEEAIKKIKFYLSHPDKLEKISKAALKTAREHHTWDIRIQNLLQDLGVRNFNI